MIIKIRIVIGRVGYLDVNRKLDSAQPGRWTVVEQDSSWSVVE